MYTKIEYIRDTYNESQSIKDGSQLKINFIAVS